MRTLIATISAGLFVLALGACGPMTSEKLAMSQGMTPKGSAFHAALHQGYLQQAQKEVAEKHLSAGEIWVAKADAAAGGGDVAPEEIANWGVAAQFVDELAAARTRLTAALGQGAAAKAPEQAAKAQVMFDCWVEEQSENIQPPDIAACKKGYEEAMAAVDEALKPKEMAMPEKPAMMPEPPKPVEQEVSEHYVIYFDFDSSQISEAGKQVLAIAVASAKGAKKAYYTVSGHTDRAGANDYNMKLAEERADQVALSLMDSGIEPRVIRMRHYGEEQNAVPTDDGVREQYNRRVEIDLEKTVVVGPSS